MRRENPIVSLYYTTWNRFRLQKYRNGGQLWVVNVFSYTIHAQTDCCQSRSPLTLSIFFPLLLWRCLSSHLFCVHYTWMMNWKGLGRKRPWPNFRLYSCIYLEGLTKITKNLRIANLWAEVLTPGPQKYEAVVLSTRPRCSVNIPEDSLHTSRWEPWISQKWHLS
jgi:hypothetical protein